LTIAEKPTPNDTEKTSDDMRRRGLLASVPILTEAETQMQRQDFQARS
jgi:hypothetical protein